MSSIVSVDRYEINLNAPLPELSLPFAQAYSVQDITHPKLKLYALKTSVFPCPRHSCIDIIKDLCHNGKIIPLLRMAYAANVAWEPSSLNRSMVFIYYYPGPPLMKSLTARIQPWTEERIAKKLVAPIIEVLSHLQHRQMSHHAIRPTNIFYENEMNMEEILLGDCLTTPPGYTQPSYFEPLSLAKADPISRGEATIAEDLFALGVTICFLLNGGSPIDLTDEAAITFNRMEHGSFATFVPPKKISPHMLDLLRGLLMDDKEMRWGLREVSTWLSGGRITQSGVVIPKRASRPLNFNGQKNIYTPHLLADEMRKNPVAALNFMSKNDLVIWLKNGLNDPLRVHLLEDLKTVTLHSTSASEKLMGVLQILDTGSPFFWQGKNFTAQGLGNSLAYAVINDDPLEGYNRLISSPVLSYYLKDTRVLGPVTEEETLGRKLQQLRNTLEYQGIGGGIESCLYQLARHIPCLSPAIRDYNALTVPEILQALNILGHQQHRPDSIIDRHIAAFIVARDPGVRARLFHDMNTSSIFVRHTVILKLLAELQDRYRIKSLPGLTKWVVDLSLPLLTQYKSIPLRKSLESKLKELREKGNLSSILKIIDNKKLLDTDLLALKKAHLEVSYIEKKIKEIALSLEHPIHYSQKIGHHTAMTICAILSFGFSFVYILSKIIKL